MKSERSEFAWRPDEATISRAQLTRFLGQCGMELFAEMYQRSITDVAWFTDQLLKFLKIPFDHPYTRVADFSAGIAWARWCVDGKLNITRTLDVHAATRPTQPAVIWEGEEGATRTLTFAQLKE